MLQSIRDKAQGVFAWVIIIIIIIPFALWGIQEYLGGGGSVAVASVAGEEITQREFQSAYQNQLQRLRGIFGARFSQFMPESRVKKQVIDQLVQEKVLLKSTREFGYRVGDERVIREIQKIPAFQKNGVFDHQEYKRKVGWQGMSPKLFESRIKNALANDQFSNGIKDSAFVIESNAKKYEQLMNQQRNFSYMQILVSSVSNQVKVSDEEIKQYYQKHLDEYEEAEKVKVEYIELSVELLAKGLKPSEKELTKAYNDQKDKFIEKEKRKVSHILIQLDDTSTDDEKKKVKVLAEKVLTKVKSGGNFSELAKTYSDDPGSKEQGGDLGYINRGEMVAEFENAVFKMIQGEISGLVKTEYGYHIIKLTELVEETTKSFESVKSQLVKSIQGQEAENIFFEKSELLTNLVFENSDSLEPAANELELKIQQSDWFSRAGGNAFSQQPKIISTSFSDVVFKNRLNSEPIETSTNKLIVLRFKDSQPAKNKSLESVKKEIRATLKLEKSKAMVRVQGLKLFKELSNGGKLEDIAKKEKVSVVNKTDIMRNDTVIPNIIVSSVFKSIKPANGKATYSKAILPSGDYVLIQLTKVSNKVLDKTNKIDAIEKNKQLIQSIGTDEIEAVLSGLKKATDVQIFSDNL